MAVLKNNAGWFGLSGVLLGLLAGLWWAFTPVVPPAHAAASVAKTAAAAWWNEGYSPLDPLAAAQLERLRHDGGFDDDALAALDLGATQLESLLANLRGWYEANTTALAAQWAALADQQALVRHYQAEIGQGRDQAANLAQAQQQLAQLQSAYETFLATPRQAAATAANLSEGQRSQADGLRARQTTGMPFRLLALDARQTTALEQTLARYNQHLATAGDNEARAAARSRYEQELATAVGGANAQALHNLSYLGPASERVVAAVQLVLPGRTD